MRTFTCLTTQAGSDDPSLSFIFAADEHRARDLAKRELAEARIAAKVELYEDGKLLMVEEATLSSADGSARADGARAAAKPPRPAPDGPRRWPGATPDELARFINGQKIQRYGESLAHETEPDRTPALKALLIREENRFGAYTEKLDAARGVMADLAQRIEAQHGRIARLRELNCDITLAEQLLEQFEHTAQLFAAFADHVERELGSVAL